MFPLLIFLHLPNLSDLVDIVKEIKYFLLSKADSMIDLIFIYLQIGFVSKYCPNSFSVL